MRNISIIDETFDINISSSYHLYIQITTEGLSFIVMDSIRKKFIALKNLMFEAGTSLSKEDQIKRFLTRDYHLTRKYKSTRIIYSTRNSTIIPNPLFDDDKTEDLYRFSNQLPENHSVITNELKCIDSKVAFSIPDKILNALKDHPNRFKLFHQSCPEIENAALTARQNPNDNQVMALIYPDFFDLIVFRNSKFELYNSFAFKVDQDIVFYILYVIEQFGLKNENFKLSLAGDINKPSNLVEKLSQFIPEIGFEKFRRNYSYSYAIEQLDHHLFTNLINLQICE